MERLYYIRMPIYGTFIFYIYLFLAWFRLISSSGGKSWSHTLKWSFDNSVLWWTFYDLDDLGWVVIIWLFFSLFFFTHGYSRFHHKKKRLYANKLAPTLLSSLTKYTSNEKGHKVHMRNIGACAFGALWMLWTKGQGVLHVPKLWMCNPESLEWAFVEHTVAMQNRHLNKIVNNSVFSAETSQV